MVNSHLRDAIIDLHGKERGAVNWFARITGLSPDHITRVINGRSPTPEWMRLLVVLLRLLPRDKWPSDIRPDWMR